MAQKDGSKKRTPKVRQNRQSGNPEGRPRSVDSVENPGRESGSDEISVSRENSQRRDVIGLNAIDTESAFGKILSQLREIRKAHLAYVKAHESRLETRLKENREYQQDAIQKMDDLEEEIINLLQQQDDEAE